MKVSIFDLGREAAKDLEATENIANLCCCLLGGVVMMRGNQLCGALCIFRSFISSENGQREHLLGSMINLLSSITKSLLGREGNNVSLMF